MDKVSFLLITGIVSLVALSGIMIFDIWAEGKNTLDEIETVEENAVQGYSSEGMESTGSGMFGGELIFNEDTSFTNQVNKHLWLRVKIVYNNKYDEDKYTVISKGIESDWWHLEKDGWYYSMSSTGFARTTEPLIDRLLYNGKAVSQGSTGKFRLQVETVDEAMLLQKPESGREAFLIFKKVHKRPEQIDL